MTRLDYLTLAVVCCAVVLWSLLIVTACTYSVSVVHTEGTAQDIIDDTQTATPTTTIPLNLGLPNV